MRRSVLLLLCPLLLATLSSACGDDDGSGPAEPTPTPTTSPTRTGAPPTDRLSAGPVFTGAAANDALTSIATGDFNADGSLDLALGAAFTDTPGGEDAGSVYVFLGPLADGTEEISVEDADIVLTGVVGEQAGRSLASGDITGDGVDDLVIGAPAAGGGRVYLIVGAGTLGEVPAVALGDSQLLVSGAAEGAFLGFTIEVGDFNGDGTGDLAVGTLLADGPGGAREDAGAVHIFYGPPGPAADATLHGAEAGDRLGEALAAADFNGDGRVDLVVVATFGDGPENSREDAGETYVFTSVLAGEIDLADSAPPVTIFGIDPGDQLGHSAAGLDFNGDGYDDLVLGAVSADGPDNLENISGEVALVFGSAAPPETIDSGSGDVPVLTGLPQSRLGRTVAAGDLDGDGYDDALLAAPEGPDNAGTPGTGAVYIVRGGPDGSFPERAEGVEVVYGRAAGDNLGGQVHGTPPILTTDLNGDGRDDVVVSAARANEERGEVLVLLAKPES